MLELRKLSCTNGSPRSIGVYYGMSGHRWVMIWSNPCSQPMAKMFTSQQIVPAESNGVDAINFRTMRDSNSLDFDTHGVSPKQFTGKRLLLY